MFQLKLTIDDRVSFQGSNGTVRAVSDLDSNMLLVEWDLPKGYEFRAWIRRWELEEPKDD